MAKQPNSIYGISNKATLRQIAGSKVGTKLQGGRVITAAVKRTAKARLKAAGSKKFASKGRKPKGSSKGKGGG